MCIQQFIDSFLLRLISLGSTINSIYTWLPAINIIFVRNVLQKYLSVLDFIFTDFFNVALVNFQFFVTESYCTRLDNNANEDQICWF